MNLVKYITPINLEEEQVKFFSSKAHNPQFRYCWQEPEALVWVEQHQEYQKLALALIEQNTGQIIAEAKKIFQTQLEPGVLHLANQTISHHPRKLSSSSPAEFATKFTEVLSKLGLRHYVVEVVDQPGFFVRPLAHEHKIQISKHANWEYFSIDGEIKHELTHIVRYENGIFNNIPISPDYLPTEEGLATFCQDYWGDQGELAIFQHAAEYAVTEVALNSSLRAMVEFLIDHGFSPKLAYQRSVRHKFGFVDSSMPGDIIKPSMYFYHEQRIKKLTQDQIFRLFVGKISFEQIEDFPIYKGKISLDALNEIYLSKIV
ncbi:MAG TPA: hypothetical protein PKX78_03260 [Candidatus Woesebacteria bacterium]|nr:hypothetical protein [Candidatus Woesebacteria bacterium]